MKHIKVFEQFIGEATQPAKPDILVKLFKELSKAKNLNFLLWDYNTEDGHIIRYKNGLDSEEPRHKGESDAFSFYLDDNGKDILGIYDLNGHDQELKTVKDALNWSRANEK